MNDHRQERATPCTLGEKAVPVHLAAAMIIATLNGDLISEIQ